MRSRVLFQRLVLASAAASIVLSGCATRGGSIPYEVTGFDAPDMQKPAVLPEGYTIAPGDTLTVTVFQAETLSKDYIVDPAGNIAMPLIGSVKAVGLTTSTMRDSVSQRLGEKYMRNPDVTVAVKESVNRLITIDGSVRSPGMFPVIGQLSLIQAVALARGTDENSNPRRVAIFRTIDGARMAAAFDLTSIRRGEMPDPQVYAGDIVVVDGSSSTSLFRTVIQTLPVVALFRPY